MYYFTPNLSLKKMLFHNSTKTAHIFGTVDPVSIKISVDVCYALSWVELTSLTKTEPKAEFAVNKSANYPFVTLLSLPIMHFSHSLSYSG